MGDRIEPREEQQQMIFSLLKERQAGIEALEDAMRSGRDVQGIVARLNAFGFDIRRRHRAV